MASLIVYIVSVWMLSKREITKPIANDVCNGVSVESRLAAAAAKSAENSTENGWKLQEKFKLGPIIYHMNGSFRESEAKQWFSLSSSQLLDSMKSYF